MPVRLPGRETVLSGGKHAHWNRRARLANKNQCRMGIRLSLHKKGGSVRNGAA